MKIEAKKSAIDLTELAIGIVILGIAVSIGATILLNVGKSQITQASTYTVANETVTPTGGNVLAQTWVKSVDMVINSSSGSLVGSSNYTLSVNADTGIGTITNTTATTLFPTWKVSYTVYNVTDPRFYLPNKAQLGLAEYGNWFKILVIVGIAAVILALIFMAFGNKSSSEGGFSY